MLRLALLWLFQEAQILCRYRAVRSAPLWELSPDSIYSYFREIALHSPIDVTLYNIPMFANPIDLSTIRRLAELERIVGTKDSSGDLAMMMRMISAVMMRMISAVRPNRPDFTS